MKNNQKGFVAPVLLAIITLLVIGGGVYIYESKKVETPVVPVDTNVQTTTQVQTKSIQTTSAPQVNNSKALKAYYSKNYGIEITYPANWFIHESNDGQSFSFFKSATTPPARAFAAFYITDLNVAKEGGAPHYVTPQEYFNYYFADYRFPDSPITLIQFGQIPIIHLVTTGDNRYVVYTNDRQLSFVLYPGSTQNPTEYTSGDDLAIENVIKTLTITDLSKHFVKVTPSGVSTGSDNLKINSVLPPSDQVGISVGTTITVNGTGFSIKNPVPRTGMSSIQTDAVVIMQDSSGQNIPVFSLPQGTSHNDNVISFTLPARVCKYNERGCGDTDPYSYFYHLIPGTYKLFIQIPNTDYFSNSVNVTVK